MLDLFRKERPGNFCWIHVSLVPVLNVVGEQALDENVKMKLSQFCHVSKDNIITLYDVSNIWHIPLLLSDQKAHEAIFQVLNLQSFLWIELQPLIKRMQQLKRILMLIRLYERFLLV
ncbi:uncharacterized protein LOC115724568 isoform X2 [Cannabis sativa]|uniref:uncharacterized protein LOC115724568 isoform X2 n=1 Tax=Cannabis sativa TaxID=3483 RepID=UPI0029CA696D|nr:uncharacterized protein LOC115724568 isoform X2 [Cannabis sativa]